MNDLKNRWAKVIVALIAFGLFIGFVTSPSVIGPARWLGAAIAFACFGYALSVAMTFRR